MPKTPSRTRSLALLGCVLVVFAPGCVSRDPMVSAQVMSEVDVDQLDAFYVLTHDGDRGVGELIVKEIQSRGKQVQWGPDGPLPEGTRVLVVYDDSWMWDMTMYLLLLRVDFRDPETNVLLAAGSSSRPSMMRAKPEQMVREAMAGMFQGGLRVFPDRVIE